GRDLAGGIVEVPLDIDLEVVGAPGDQRAAGRGKRPGVDRDPAGDGFGTREVERLAVQAERAVTDDAAGRPTEICGVQLQRALAGVFDAPPSVVDGPACQAHVAARGDQAGIAVVQQTFDLNVQAG